MADRLTGGDSSLLRRINAAVTLRALRDGQSVTLTQLVGDTGLSRPTVEGVIEGLVESGLVAEVEQTQDSSRQRGRPARWFRFRAEAGHTLGIEIGVHGIRVVLADLAGQLIGSHSRLVDEALDAEERLGAVRTAVAEVLRKAGVSRDNLWAVGVGSPGIVDKDGSVQLGTAMPGWTGLDLGARLRRSFRCPVLIENDANLAVIAEHWQGAAVGMGDVVFVLAGLSPGAGSLINGRLHRGFGGAAGEIGALHLLGQEATPERLLSTTGKPLDPLDEAAVARVLRLARRATRSPGWRWTASCADWCTMWRRWCWRSIPSWWWSAAGPSDWTTCWSRCASSSRSTACARPRSRCPRWARTWWRWARCGSHWTRWRSSSSRSPSRSRGADGLSRPRAAPRGVRPSSCFAQEAVRAAAAAATGVTSTRPVSPKVSLQVSAR